MSYETFWCVVLLSIFTSCAVFERKGRVKTQTMSKNAQWYYTPKRLKSYLSSTSLFHAHFLKNWEKRSVPCAADRSNRFFFSLHDAWNNQLNNIAGYLYSIRAFFVIYWGQVHHKKYTVLFYKILFEIIIKR